MIWENFVCKSNSTSKCPADSYEINGKCTPLSQQCAAGSIWNTTNGCVPVSNVCPSGSYYNGVKCVPFQSCPQGRVWNDTISQCVCPNNAFYNGVECIKCSEGQLYSNGGCFCPEGTFFNGSRCQTQTANQCISIINSNWNGTHCVCKSGYSTSGNMCYC